MKSTTQPVGFPLEERWLNESLISKMKDMGAIKSPKIEEAFRVCPRGYFVPKGLKPFAYEDRPIMEGFIHLSAPHMYAYMLDFLNLEKGQTFFDIGCGSGWFTTLAGLLVGETGIAYGIDIAPEIIEFSKNSIACAREVLKLTLPQTEFFVQNVFFVTPEAQQYDRILCGTECPEKYVKYIKNLLKAPGVLVIPVGNELLRITRISENEFNSEVLLKVSFKMMIVPSDAEIQIEHKKAELMKEEIVKITHGSLEKTRSIIDNIRKTATSIEEIDTKTKIFDLIYSTATTEDSQYKILLNEISRQMESVKKELQQLKITSPAKEDIPSNQQTPLSQINYNDLVFDKPKVKLGKGAQAKVLKGKLHGTPVAIKIYTTKGNIDELTKEASLLSSLRHPNIVLLLGVTQTNDKYPVVVTEFMEKGSLYDVLHGENKETLSKGTMISIAHQIALGMNYLHSTKGVHRDLKSQNVLLNSNFIAKIADFGVSRIVHKTMLSQATTLNIGTPVYSAPEVFVPGAKPKDRQSYQKIDVYSYGILLWELFSANIPYTHLQISHPFELIMQVNSGTRPEPLPNAPEEFLSIMKNCWQGMSSERPSFAEILGNLAPLKVSGNRSKSTLSAKDCVICFENPRNCVLLNCAHVAVCISCGDQLRTCPICCQPIGMVKKIFFS